ncbi:MAG: glucoamylase family protein [Marinoscillum sp.]
MRYLHIHSYITFFLLIIGVTLIFRCEEKSEPKPALVLSSLQINNQSLFNTTIVDVSLNSSITASFNLAIDTTGFTESLSIIDEEENTLPLRINFFNGNRSLTIYPIEPLNSYTEYTITFTNVKSADGETTFSGTDYKFRTLPGLLVLESITAGSIDLTERNQIRNVPLSLQIIATFSANIDEESIDENTVQLKKGNRKVGITTTVDGRQLTIASDEEIDYYTAYDLVLDESINSIGAIDFEGFETNFITELDSTLKFPEISDDELLTKIQEQTFKYFWDFGHPTSGLARERNTSGETVTIGGSGFGVMSIIVGIERGFITREEGVQRLSKIVNFLHNHADRFHGVWSHWLNGTTGTVRPFSSKDNGGDLVETSFMIQGLITVRQYLDASNSNESQIIDKINTLWEAVEWDWYTQGDQNVLYWHWSPNFGWEMNHKIQGWNEALIVYVLAASSPTHSIDKSVYTSGWARNGVMVNSNGNSYYNYQLDLRSDKGGPLFFSHYSFLGLDPRNLSDQYASYWDQNVNHSLINWAYCQANPKDYVGYTAHCWGLTASDNHQGYNAHSPDNDLGVITPTAAISSIPYTPEQSMKAIKHFYYIVGDRLWGDYGFYDAINFNEEWTASSYLAIDQGPIIVMIENHRSGLLWDLFMSAPEIQNGLDKLDMSYE